MSKFGHFCALMAVTGGTGQAAQLARGPNYSESMALGQAARQYDLAEIRANPTVMIGQMKVDFRPVLNNPMALFNVAQRLRTRPQLITVTADETQISQASEGLVMHNVLRYKIRPSLCANAQARTELASVGVKCFEEGTLSERLASFSTPGNPRYIADSVKRAQVIAQYPGQIAAANAEMAAHVAAFRAASANNQQRAAMTAKIGAAELQRLDALSDQQLIGDLINSSEVNFEESIFVPRLAPRDVVSLSPMLDRRRFVQPLGAKGSTRSLQRIVMGNPYRPIAAIHNPNDTMTMSKGADRITTHSASDMFLTGFTSINKYNWRRRWGVHISYWCCSSDSDWFIEPHAAFHLNYGLRFATRADLEYAYTKKGDDGSENATVTVNFAPVYGTTSNFGLAGLSSDKMFDAKELVADMGADAGIHYAGPYIGEHDPGVSVAKDFTDDLPSPITGGHFLPPSPGSGGITTAPIVFKDLDILGGIANFGFAGVTINPEVSVNLHSDALTFTLNDNVTNQVTPLTSSGLAVPVGVDASSASSVTLSNPVYNLSFKLIPGIRGDPFIDVILYSNDWPFDVSLPFLAVEVAPGGVNFACHSGTICSHDYSFVPDPQGNTNADGTLKDSGGGNGGPAPSSVMTYVCPPDQQPHTINTKFQKLPPGCHALSIKDDASQPHDSPSDPR